MTKTDVSLDRCAVSIIAVPKPFRGHTATIQNNAIGSWNRLPITREVILLGDEEGVKEAAEKAGAGHHSRLGKDSFGTPLLDDIFRLAEKHATAQWLCYVNADIILMPEFGDAVKLVISTLGTSLIISRRWNLEVRSSLSFAPGWQQEMRELAAKSSELFTIYGIDIFVFPKGLFSTVPSFSLGRTAWDNWLVAEARRTGFPVVDVTSPYTVIHQNHSYSGFKSLEDIRRSQQGVRNFQLAGGSTFLLGHVGDATHQLEDGRIVPSGSKSVSIVIAYSGNMSSLRACLRALSHQTYPLTYLEIIIVDNSPENLGAAIALEFPFVRVTRESARDSAAARNKGAAIARGEILAFLDTDCIASTDWLENAVAAAEKTALTSIIACNIEPTMSDPGWEASNLCNTGALIVPETIWRRVGPFDETVAEAGFEDCGRPGLATYRGIPVACAKEATVHLILRGNWRKLRDRSYRQARGAIRLTEQQSNGRRPKFRSLLRVYMQRWICNLWSCLRDERVPLKSRLSTAVGSSLMFFWTISRLLKNASRRTR